MNTAVVILSAFIQLLANQSGGQERLRMMLAGDAVLIAPVSNQIPC